jgi:RNA polymerase sigma factor (sigma-70 family)
MSVIRLPRTTRREQQLGLSVHDRVKAVIDEDADSHEQVVTSIEHARLRRSVRSLPALERHVIVWRYGLDGTEYSMREIASRLGMSSAGAQAIHDAALDRLRGQLTRVAA